MDMKYPDITVRLVGENGNIFNLIGITAGALRDARVPREEIDAFRDAVRSSHSYDEALRVIMGTVNVL